MEFCGQELFLLIHMHMYFSRDRKQMVFHAELISDGLRCQTDTGLNMVLKVSTRPKLSWQPGTTSFPPFLWSLRTRLTGMRQSGNGICIDLVVQNSATRNNAGIRNTNAHLTHSNPEYATVRNVEPETAGKHASLFTAQAFLYRMGEILTRRRHLSQWHLRYFWTSRLPSAKVLIGWLSMHSRESPYRIVPGD